MGKDGILNVNKPRGYTSFNIVSQIRRLTGEKRVGHTGTLDPAASGVLPVCLGQATRISEYLINYSKEYVAVIELGITTDTFDGLGNIIGRSNPGSVTLKQVEDALQNFAGKISQVPPSFSAIKIKGKPAYKMARAGSPVPLQPREVRIDNIEILGFADALLEVKIQCSKGTYIRSIANDMGDILGCGAYLKYLTRTACGPFKIDCSVSLEDIYQACNDGNLEKIMHPIDYPIVDWGKYDLDAETTKEIIRGRDITLSQPVTEEQLYCRAYSSGKFLAILKFVPGIDKWHPEKVFNL